MHTMSTPNELLRSRRRHAAPAALDRFSRRIARVAAVLDLWFDRARSRRELRGMDDRMLRDIGAAPQDAAREADKYFWEE